MTNVRMTECQSEFGERLFEFGFDEDWFVVRGDFLRSVDDPELEPEQGDGQGHHEPTGQVVKHFHAKLDAKDE